MENKKSEKLLKDYLNGQCSPEEEAIVETWYYEKSGDQQDELPEPDYPAIKEEVFATLKRDKMYASGGVKKLWRTLAAAVACICLVGLSLFYTFKNPSDKTNQQAQNIVPGSNKAMLTLSNGEKINLTDFSTSELAEQSGIRILKNADGQLVYTIVDDGEDGGAQLYNKIETPHGGSYQVNLPDGTRVWLNSGSSLRYPLHFAATARKVELTGECYFEVKGDKKRPFLVSFANQTVEVLGTHFNINAYTDENDTKTTLLEGSIRLHYPGAQKMLKPGQQASVAGNTMTLAEVDTEQAIAWRLGDFAFDGTSLKTIMRQISRWYDVDVSYTGAIADEHFGGSISRKKSIQEVLKVLEMTQGVHFKIEGRRILVMP